MGDRTNVTLTILASQAKEAGKIMGYLPEKSSGVLTEFFFDEVNYGELDELPLLQGAGIAYDSDWGSGGEYREGCQSCRFSPEGEMEITEVYAGEENVSIDKLMTIIEKNDPDSEEAADHSALYQELETLILDHHAKVTPRSWENQEEYGKIYRTRQLISPT